MSREGVIALLELLVPAAPFLLLFFKGVRAFIHRQYKRVFPVSMHDINEKLDRVLHEVLPNNGGSMRDEMRRGNEMMKATLSSSDEGQIEFDARGQLTWANEPIMRWTGRSERELKGLGWLSIIAERDQADFQQRFENAMKYNIELRQKCRMRGVNAIDLLHNGVAYFDAEWRVVVVRDPLTDVVIGYSGNVRRPRVTGEQPAMPPRPVYEDNGA